MIRSKGSADADVAATLSRLEDMAWYSTPRPSRDELAGAALAYARACGLNRDALEAADALAACVPEFVEWGAMTGSDLELWRRRFGEALAAYREARK